MPADPRPGQFLLTGSAQILALREPPGFPEAVRRTAARRGAFFESYLTNLIERDVSELRVRAPR
jgi:hypothetical protein